MSDYSDLLSSLDDLAASGDSLCREAAEAIRAIQAARSETGDIFSRWDAALERSAQICEGRAAEWDSSVREGSEQRAYEETVLMECAAAIRGLKGAAPSATRRTDWIEVGERLPTEARDQIICLAYTPTDSDGDASVPGAFVASYDDGEWHSRMDTGCWEPGDVTHWMPFPGGPNG